MPQHVAILKKLVAPHPGICASTQGMLTVRLTFLRRFAYINTSPLLKTFEFCESIHEILAVDYRSNYHGPPHLNDDVSFSNFASKCQPKE